MKRIINTALIAIAIASAVVGNIDARIRIQRTKSAASKTQNKALYTNTKSLKNSAATPDEKAKTATKLANKLAGDKIAGLVIQEQYMQEEIEAKKAEIAAIKGGYFSWVDEEELTETKAELKNLEEELDDIQKKLNRPEKTQPKAVISLKKWAVITLITAIGIAAADELITKGAGRKAVISGIGTAGSKIKSGVETGWSYVPSLRSTSPSTEGTLTGSRPIVQATGDVGLTTAYAAWDIVKTAGTMVITQKIAEQMIKLLEDPNTDPAEKNEIRKTLAEWEAEKAEQQR